MKYKVAYAQVMNAGDLLNVHIVKNIFGIDIECTSCYRAQISGIGSSLGNFQKSEEIRKRILQTIIPKQKIYIWGTGFINHEVENEQPFYNPNMIFKAVRGKLSLARVEKLTGQKYEIPVCDGGILTSLMFEKPIEKKYRLGVIPHYKEQNELVFKKLVESNNRSIMIDLKSEPMKVYEQIGSCDYVLSSSLHGLIIADSFGIPNMHIKVTNNMLGDGFKFEDYYSGYDLKDEANKIDMKMDLPRINDIIDNYKIDFSIVKEKQEQMIQCFPKIK